MAEDLTEYKSAIFLIHSQYWLGHLFPRCFPHLKHRLFQIQPLRQAVFLTYIKPSHVCTSFRYDRNETTFHRSVWGEGYWGTCLPFNRQISHALWGCASSLEQNSLFSGKSIASPIGSCPNWLTLYIDKHKHCAVSLNGERVHLYLCAFAVNGGPLLLLWSDWVQTASHPWLIKPCVSNIHWHTTRITPD